MKIGIPKEILSQEQRVAITPENTQQYLHAGFEIILEQDAGKLAGFSNEAYQQAGAKILSTATAIYQQADIVLKINAPLSSELTIINPHSILIADFHVFSPQTDLSIFQKEHLTCFALDLIPRISRAQSVDILSSQNTLAGYKAVIDTAAFINRSIPLLMTAGGTIPPLKFLIIGLGVAGLQAAATAKRLGGIVTAYDIRPETKEQAQSVGAKFTTELNKTLLNNTDIVIASAFSPDKKAPLILDQEQISALPEHAVLTDLAAPLGGNIFGSQSGKITQIQNRTIIGCSNLAAELSNSSSRLFSQNLFNFVKMLNLQTEFKPDFSDEIIRSTCIIHNGKTVHPHNQTQTGD